MAKKKKLKHGGITVTIEEDGVDVISEAPEGMSSSPTFTLFKALANIFLYTEGTDYKQKKNQKDKFSKKITFEIPIPDDVLDHPTVKQKGKDILKLAYFDKNKGDWVLFDKQKLDKKANLGIVEFNEWLKDPHVGWGSS